MKKILPLLLLAAFLLQTAAAAEPDTDGYDESKLFDLAAEGTGYRLYFPHYAGSESRVLTVDGAAFEADVHLFDDPPGDGDVLLFEVMTSDPDARYLDVRIGDDLGIAAELKGLELSGGKAAVQVSRRLWETNFKDRLLHADIFSYDRDGEMLWHFFEIYFLFREPAGREAEPPAPAAEAGETRAQPITTNVSVDGRTVSFDAYAIGGNIYLKLRDLAMALNGTGKRFEVRWDGARNAISLISGESYTPAGGELAVTDGRKTAAATPNRSKIYVDGREMRFTAYTIGGNNYFKLRDIAKTFNIGVTWDGAAKMVGLDTEADYTE
jgi:hypothetical protein